MSADFTPHNDLENQLLKAQQGELSEGEFLQSLMDAELFMPVYEKHNIGNLQTTDKAQPLKLEDEDGCPVLVLFTSPDRAKPFVKDFPGYNGGLLVELTWVFEKLGAGFGIALNPGWPVGVDLQADAVAQLSQIH
jgi:hypothetical protein